MARRTQLFTQMPWTGGVNTSVDSGVLPPNDLTVADNVIFSSAASRLKREGFSYFDTAIPASATRSSSGTTRTIVFASSVDIASPKDQILVVGEKINVTGSSNSVYNCTAGTIASVSTTTITYTFSGATSVSESSTADTGIVVTKSSNVLACIDFWYYDTTSHTKLQTVVQATDQALFFRHDSAGRRTQITKDAGAAAITGTLTSVDLLPFNEKLIITMSGYGNTPKIFAPAVDNAWRDLGGSPPDAEFMREHQGRIWMNDKLNLDLLHFSATFDETLWKGVGDSGALPVSQGDGDPVGISAIYPPFKDMLIIGKGNKAYKMVGFAPEEYQIVPLSTGIGAISHQSCVAVDLDDVVFASRRGFHTAVATDTTGDFESNFLSKNIQPSFNRFKPSRLQFIRGVYIPTLNSIAYAVSEAEDTYHTSLWLYNVEYKAWYRWPNANAQSVCKWLDTTTKERLLFGNNAGRLVAAQNSTNTDFATTATAFRVKSGQIYVDNNPQTMKAFKKLSLLFKPRGDYAFQVYFKVDNYPVQALNFEQSAGSATLGTTLVLGTSVLASENVLAPFTRDIEGYGRGCSIEVLQSALSAQVELYGMMIEYENIDIADEVVLSGD